MPTQPSGPASPLAKRAGKIISAERGADDGDGEEFHRSLLPRPAATSLLRFGGLGRWVRGQRRRIGASADRRELHHDSNASDRSGDLASLDRCRCRWARSSSATPAWAQVPDPAADASLPGGALITQVLGWLKYAAIAVRGRRAVDRRDLDGRRSFRVELLGVVGREEVDPRRHRRGDDRRTGPRDRDDRLQRDLTDAPLTRHRHRCRRGRLGVVVARRTRDARRRDRIGRRSRQRPPRRRLQPAAADRPSPVQAAVAAVRLTGEIAKAGFIRETRPDRLDRVRHGSPRRSRRRRRRNCAN